MPIFVRLRLVRIPIALLALALILAGAGAVGAHAEYRSSVPGNGASVQAPPAKVVITFSKETSATKSNGAVTDTAGATVSTGWAVDLNDRTKLTINLRPSLPNGIYTVKYTSLSEDDGHTVDGAFIFTVNPNAPESSGVAPAAPANGGGAPWGLWIALFAALTVVVVGGLLLLTRRRGATGKDADADIDPLT